MDIPIKVERTWQDEKGNWHAEGYIDFNEKKSEGDWCDISTCQDRSDGFQILFNPKTRMIKRVVVPRDERSNIISDFGSADVSPELKAKGIPAALEEGESTIDNFSTKPDVHFDYEDAPKPIIKVERNKEAEDAIADMVERLCVEHGIPKRIFEGSTVKGLASSELKYYEQWLKEVVAWYRNMVFEGKISGVSMETVPKSEEVVETTTIQNKRLRTFVPKKVKETVEKVILGQETDLVVKKYDPQTGDIEVGKKEETWRDRPSLL